MVVSRRGTDREDTGNVWSATNILYLYLDGAHTGVYVGTNSKRTPEKTPTKRPKTKAKSDREHSLMPARQWGERFTISESRRVRRYQRVRERQVLARVWGEGGPSALLAGTRAGAGALENSMGVLRKLHVELPYDPATALLGVYPKAAKLLSQRVTCT